MIKREDLEAVVRQLDMVARKLGKEPKDILSALSDYYAQKQPEKVSVERAVKYAAEFDVLGTFWFGKPSGSMDFTMRKMEGGNDKNYDVVRSLLQAHRDSRTRKSVVVYQPKDSQQRYIFCMQNEDMLDDAGRPMHQLHGLRASSNVNPLEQLLHVFDADLSRDKHYKFNDNVSTESQKNTIENDYVFSQRKQNELVAKLVFGESVVVDRTGVKSLCSLYRCLPDLAQWVGLIPKNYYLSQELKSRNEVGIFVSNSESPDANSTECNQFAQQVLGRLGDKNAHWDVLLEVPDAKKRLDILKCYVSGAQMPDEGKSWINLL